LAGAPPKHCSKETAPGLGLPEAASISGERVTVVTTVN
jgi:hypothetical protein